MSATCPSAVPWAVWFDGGFFGKRKPYERPGEEIALNARFSWNHEIWHVPAAYLFAKGLVVDFCVEIDPERERAFIENREPMRIAEERLTRERHRQIDCENPLNIEFRPDLMVNGKPLGTKCRTAISWIPTDCLPDDVQNDERAGHVLAHYGLDATKAWSFHRATFLWATTRKPTLRALSLKLARDAVEIDGSRFANPSVGDVIPFVHPIFGTPHRLTVLGYAPQHLSFRPTADPKYDLPSHHIAMTYALAPDIPDKNFQIRDCADSDEPKIHVYGNGGAFGIIGGADGPTAVILADRKHAEKPARHAAVSALHFEPPNSVTWQMVFREKLTDDIDIDLL